MANLWSEIQSFFWNILHNSSLIDIVDILLVALIIYELIILSRQTRAIQVLKGLGILILFRLVSQWIGLTSINWMLEKVLNSGVLVLVVLFQPELRRALGEIGRGTKISSLRFKAPDGGEKVIDELIECCLHLSKRRVGALIVFEQKTGLKDVIDTGCALDSLISAPLLENIFEPNTPLHDGAVIIRDQRIVAAACVLSLSQSDSIPRDLGTRHRAALGISESTDAIVLIVSEETGIISMTRSGKIIRHLDADSLRRILNEIYVEKPAGMRNAVSQFFGRNQKNAE